MTYSDWVWLGGGLFLAWFGLEALGLLRAGGPCKRGVGIWREALPPAMAETLSALPSGHKDWRGFIRVEGDEVLVQTSPLLFSLNIRTPWVCVGYIDLRRSPLCIEYRVTWSGLLSGPIGVIWLLAMFAPQVQPLSVSGLANLAGQLAFMMLPFWGVVVLASYASGRGIIRGYLHHVYQKVLRPLPTDAETRQGQWFLARVMFILIFGVVALLFFWWLSRGCCGG